MNNVTTLTFSMSNLSYSTLHNTTPTHDTDEADYMMPRPPGDILLLQGVVRWLQLCYAPAISVSGLLSNALCVLVLVTTQPSQVYTVALILAETLQLLALLHEWCNEMGADLFKLAGWCHMFTFLYKGSQFLCQWYLVCWLVNCCLLLHATSAADDTITNARGPMSTNARGPKNNRTTNNLWSPTCCARLTTISLAVLAIIVFINLSLTADVMFIELRQVHACITLDIYATVLFYLDHADVMINVLIPCVIILCCLGYIIYNKITTFWRGRRGAKDKIWIYCCLHALLWLPFQLIRIVNTITVIASQDTHNTLRAYLWQQVVIYVNYSNMVVHILFLLACHREFRTYIFRRLTDLCCWKRCVGKGRRMESIETASRRGTAIEVVTPSEDELVGDDAC